MKQCIDHFLLSENESEIVKCLESKQFATIEDLLFAVYSYSDEEPEFPENVIAVTIWRLKKKLKSQGYTIEGSGGGRGRKAKYRLVSA